ncbi:MAG: helix-turn-helix transcriptional regulator [Coriobacteriia bacterium]|nr:helix-turn-helix transcriptional regulator [Coriobacteriia bacterium]
MPTFFGISFLVAFETLLAIDAYPSAGSSFAMVGNVTRYVVCVLTFGVVALASRSLFPLSNRPHLLGLSVAACLSGGLVLIASRFLVLPKAYLIAGSILVGFGIPLLKLFWLELFARLDIIRVVLHYSMAQVLASLSIAILSLLDPRWFVIALYLSFPLLSLLCYRSSLKHYAKGDYVQGEKLDSTRWSFPVKPVLLVGLFTFTNTLVRSYLPIDARGYAALGVSLALIPIFLYAYFRSETFDARMLYRISFPLMITGPLCLIVGGSVLGVIGALSTNAAFSCFALFVVVVLCNISFRHGANPLWLFGFAWGSLDAGKLLAKITEMSLVPVAAHQTVFFCLIILALTIMFTMLMTGSDCDGTWGILVRRGGASSVTALDDIVNSCTRLARVKGLTRREEEILFLITQDCSSSVIAARLSLAESTVKTHLKHIYAKLGVHSKYELNGLIAKR